MHFLGGNERESQSTQGNLHNHTGKYSNGYTVQIIIWSKKPNSIMRTGCTDTFAKTNLTSNIGSILFLSAEMMWKEPVPLEHSPCCFHSKINHLDSHVLPCFVLFFFFCLLISESATSYLTKTESHVLIIFGVKSHIWHIKHACYGSWKLRGCCPLANPVLFLPKALPLF